MFSPSSGGQSLTLRWQRGCAPYKVADGGPSCLLQPRGPPFHPLLPPSRGLLRCVPLFPCLSNLPLRRTPVFGFRAHQVIQDRFLIPRSSITSSKTLLPGKVPFPGPSVEVQSSSPAATVQPTAPGDLPCSADAASGCADKPWA